MTRYLVEFKATRAKKWTLHADWPSRATAEMDAARLRAASPANVEVRVREVAKQG